MSPDPDMPSNDSPRAASSHSPGLPRVELVASQSDQLFRQLVDGIKDYAIFMLDPAGVITTWNSGAQALMGYQADEIIGGSFAAFYSQADRSAGSCVRALDRATRLGRHEEEGWLHRKDGTAFWGNIITTPMRDAAGVLLGFAQVTRDLTERKVAAERQRTSEERISLLVDSIKDYAIFVLDVEGNVASWNSGAERIKGYAAEEIIGSHFSRFYPEEDVRAGKCERELEGAARDGRFEDEGWRVRKDGSQFWANVVISAVRDDRGGLVGFSKVTRDLTERKLAEQATVARQAAEHANRMKDEFLAMLGHELRNPLAPIVSALQLLKLRGDAKSVREHQIIERQVAQMIRIVDDLLDISRISRGKIELRFETTDLRESLAKAVEIAIPMFEAKGQSFDVNVPPHPLWVQGDDARLTQVFSNLLNNAAKYTGPGGHITLRARELGSATEIEVRDDGKGIEESLLPRVFDLFVQGYQDVARAEGGLGIGLSLVRALVELHRGTVSARSAGPRQGSTFTVRLPASASSSPSVSDRAPLPGIDVTKKGKRVLIVDDNLDARLLLGELLEAAGHEVKTAKNGPDALALLETFDADVAVLDIGLPGMSGLELAAKVKALSRGPAVRLVAVTGYGQPSDKAASREVGFDGHLVKPIDVNKLLDFISPAAR